MPVGQRQMYERNVGLQTALSEESRRLVEVTRREVGAAVADRLSGGGADEHGVVTEAPRVLGPGVLALAHGHKVHDFHIAQHRRARHKRVVEVDRLAAGMC